MNIPSFLRTKFVASDGMLTEEWHQKMSMLFAELQANLSNSGTKLPLRSSANVAALGTSDNEGILVYNKETKKLNVNINGVMKEVQTT